MKRWLAAFFLLTALLAGGWFFGAFDWFGGLVEEKQAERALRQEDEAAFRQWLAADQRRAADFSDLSTYLAEQGVGAVVPAWTLTRGDVNRLPWCPDAGLIMPPRKSWPNIVPALRIVRNRVVPVVGRVEVRSVFRTAALNACAGGASQSRHLSFSALDMVALDQPDGRTVFAKLCRAWRRAGPPSGWGLGAYFDPDRPTANRQARFHIDATGWRSWGFSKKAGSSGCRLLDERG